ncbi:hypothetical protein [Kitasatospora sp. A2-31]|uniref:zinc finger domain-containing protein n=1 Tax=Kitasatospora sp. A2-31 TaxID=2916414 RepID=UPI001EE78D1A|nr:hypothetical protein [Kitasatospora sp. A2-31]MCG6493397.1 hypothetical protein [Kitasatospora sp. A2-31]
MPAGLRHREHPPEWAIPCPVPTCRAKPGTPCRSPRGRRLTTGSHPSRLDAWRTHQHTRPAA